MTMYMTRLGRSAALILVILLCIAIIKLTIFPQHRIVQIGGAARWENVKRVRIQSPELLYIPQDMYAESMEQKQSTPKAQINQSNQLKQNVPTKVNQPKRHRSTKILTRPEDGLPERSSGSPLTQKFSFIDRQETLIVYSAHYDQLTQEVKLIGFGPMYNNTDTLKHYICKLNREDSSLVLVTQLTVYYRITTYSPWQGQQYDSYIYKCGVSPQRPYSVTIEPMEDSTTGTELLVEPELEVQQRKHRFGVCVEPLVFNYNKTSLLKHFLAANTALGAESFYFYYTSASQAILDILNNLSDRVTVYKWPLEKLLQTTHAYGQKAANNHCLYAHRSQSRYLAYIDIDEVLVPTRGYSWSDMMNKINEEHSNNGAVILQSKLYPLTQPIEGNSDSLSDMVGLTHAKTVGVFEYHSWSKVLLDTQRTDVMDIHRVRELVQPYQAVYSNSTYGYIHHYRRFDTSTSQLYTDNSLLQHRDKLMATYKLLFPT